MPIYMKIDGIKGQVQTTGFADQIAIESLSWGTSRNVSSFTGTAREVSSPNFSEVSCMKMFDSSSQAIFRNAMFGDPLPEVVISFVRDKGQGEVEAYLETTLKNVLVTSYQVSHSSGQDAPAESFSLNFTVISNHQTWRGGDYGSGGEDDASYDMGTMAPA
jgi:type VI secretion system secreted protein Hcp